MNQREMEMNKPKMVRNEFCSKCGEKDPDQSHIGVATGPESVAVIVECIKCSPGKFVISGDAAAQIAEMLKAPQ